MNDAMDRETKQCSAIVEDAGGSSHVQRSVQKTCEFISEQKLARLQAHSGVMIDGLSDYTSKVVLHATSMPYRLSSFISKIAGCLLVHLI